MIEKGNTKTKITTKKLIGHDRINDVTAGRLVKREVIPVLFAGMSLFGDRKIKQ